MEIALCPFMNCLALTSSFKSRNEKSENETNETQNHKQQQQRSTWIDNAASIRRMMF